MAHFIFAVGVGLTARLLHDVIRWLLSKLK